ncbi:thiamine pyrophosphate-dependent enzyme, partial [Staphylococcus epidermidis]|uniref:thiamine pyrophosphate-dependent enzyme n=1 Tax=Staphylococcus epidermidis TaxID=1282 RepID=UPI0037D996BC
YQATLEPPQPAVAREPPTLIQTLTYPYPPHTIPPHHPTPYTTSHQHPQSHKKHPLLPFTKYLQPKALWNQHKQNQLLQPPKSQ